MAYVVSKPITIPYSNFTEVIGYPISDHFHIVLKKTFSRCQASSNTSTYNSKSMLGVVVFREICLRIVFSDTFASSLWYITKVLEQSDENLASLNCLLSPDRIQSR